MGTKVHWHQPGVGPCWTWWHDNGCAGLGREVACRRIEGGVNNGRVLCIHLDERDANYIAEFIEDPATESEGTYLFVEGSTVEKRPFPREEGKRKG